MNWNNETRQDFATQHEYSGYTGTHEQASQMFEQQSQQQQQQEAYRPEFQSAQMNGQVPFLRFSGSDILRLTWLAARHGYRFIAPVAATPPYVRPKAKCGSAQWASG